MYGEGKHVKAGPIAQPRRSPLTFLAGALVFLGLFPQSFLASIRNRVLGWT